MIHKSNYLKGELFYIFQTSDDFEGYNINLGEFYKRNGNISFLNFYFI